VKFSEEKKSMLEIKNFFYSNFRHFTVGYHLDVVVKPTSFPGSLFSASLGRWKKDPGCGWSCDSL